MFWITRLQKTQADSDDLQAMVDEKADQIHQTFQRIINYGIPGVPDRVPAPIYYPVIVATEGFPWNPLIAEEVEVRLAARGVLQHPLVRPLTIISLDGVEFVESNAERGLGPFLNVLEDRIRCQEVRIPLLNTLARLGGLIRPTSLDEALGEAFAQTAPSWGLNVADLEI